MALFGIFSDLFMDTGAEFCASTPTVPRRPQWTPILQPRVDELCSQLFSYSETLRTAKFNSNTVFPDAAKAVFTAENFEECVWAYFTVFHPQQPLLHWPTFDMHSVSLPLLLAVVFGGSVHCSPTDGALSCRAFFDLGEEFIFQQLRDVVIARPDLYDNPRILENVQAGLLIVALQSSFNSEAVRRRVRVSRHPELTVAIRSLRLLGPMTNTSPHNEVLGWNAFIAEESRVRIVHFMCVMDYMNTFFFNLLPSLAIGEIHTRLPCNDALYDAWTPEEYERIGTDSMGPANRIPSIKHLVAFMMGEDCLDEQKNSLLNVLELRHLMICIFALHSTVFVSRAALLISSSYDNLLRATSRWKELWDDLQAKRKTEHKSS
ncbi:hypothetical protein G6011_10262 [Alternaria panax]|uniref:Xylanolytic transcriptional activator regulatory domain-containing protein n=1 Tax=Alternaria panax TaxID=48097 RepID=A0AAD4NPE1_9PLEO|nr:hypothetical protein G6011_10262 [Alternaria panax]